MDIALEERPEETAAEAPLCANLGWLLAQASHALATEMTARLEDVGVFPRGHCVIQTAMQSEMTQTEIAQVVGLDKTTMVVTVDELEKAGFAERIPSASDRRARLIRITPAGVAKAAEAERIVAELQDEILETLPAAEREALMHGLLRLVDDRLSAPSECSRAVRRRD
jgi:MarR family transcriptional regulator, transcriptional regulator for hemolysin